MRGRNAPLFTGRVQRIRLISNRFCYGPWPAPDDEVEQRLTLTADGRVFFSVYSWGDGRKYQKTRTQNFKIPADMAALILQDIGRFFSAQQEEYIVADAGDWNIDMINSRGKAFHFSGSLERGTDALDSISAALRSFLDLPELYAFNGGTPSGQIERVILDYHRITKMKSLTWDYSERLILEREAETMELIHNIGPACQVSRKYYLEEVISSFLDSHGYYLLSDINASPPDAMENPWETKDYTLTVEFYRDKPRTVSGSFDRDGLPKYFHEFAEEIVNLMRFYNNGLGDALDPSRYNKPRRRQSDYIFCSVRFADSENTYYYLTDDDNLRIGDTVLVPVHREGKQVEAVIDDIEYFAADDAPFPLEKIKRIISRCESGDDGA